MLPRGHVASIEKKAIEIAGSFNSNDIGVLKF